MELGGGWGGIQFDVTNPTAVKEDDDELLLLFDAQGHRIDRFGPKKGVAKNRKKKKK